MSVVLHIEIRNDGDGKKRKHEYEYDSKEEAIFKALELATALDQGPINEEKARKTLQEGKALWVWEWKRKGNGDYVIVLDENTDLVEFVLNVNYQDSEDVESVDQI